MPVGPQLARAALNTDNSGVNRVGSHAPAARATAGRSALSAAHACSGSSSSNSSSEPGGSSGQRAAGVAARQTMTSTAAANGAGGGRFTAEQPAAVAHAGSPRPVASEQQSAKQRTVSVDAAAYEDPSDGATEPGADAMSDSSSTESSEPEAIARGRPVSVRLPEAASAAAARARNLGGSPLRSSLREGPRPLPKFLRSNPGALAHMLTPQPRGAPP